MNAAARWPLSTRLLHWFSAGTILFMLALGFVMVNFVTEPGRRFVLYQAHKSVGLFVLALMLVRIVWRLVRRPTPGVTIPRRHDRAARVMHISLYALTVALTLVGYASVSTSTLPLPITLPFGFQAPNLFAPDYRLSEIFLRAHHIIAVILGLCVAGHIAAALKRHLVDRDGTLRRISLF
jgi:cytochrome b561